MDSRDHPMPTPATSQIVLVAGCGSFGPPDFGCRPQSGYHKFTGGKEVYEWIRQRSQKLTAVCISSIDEMIAPQQGHTNEAGYDVYEEGEEVEEAKEWDPNAKADGLDGYKTCLRRGYGGIRADMCYTVDPTEDCKPTWQGRFQDVTPDKLQHHQFSFVHLDHIMGSDKGPHFSEALTSILNLGLSLLENGGVLYLDCLNVFERFDGRTWQQNDFSSMTSVALEELKGRLSATVGADNYLFVGQHEVKWDDGVSDKDIILTDAKDYKKGCYRECTGILVRNKSK